MDASDNRMFGEDDKSGITAWAEAIKTNTSITELNLAKNYINADDTKILGPAIGANGALASVNILRNKIPAEQAQALVVMRSKDSLTTLCGLSGKETELDFSGQNLEAGDAVLIFNDIRDNGGLTSLNLSKNLLHAEGAKHIAEAIKGHVSALRFF